MADEKIIARIRKCLALSRSSNEHEAATALRQASRLMEMHAISDTDILAAEANEERTNSRAKSRPARWEIILAQEIAGAFGCKYMLVGSRNVKQGQWVFIGCGSAPEIARYAFEVLLRQAQFAREDYIPTHLKRCQRATKTRRADLFCEGWVFTASDKVSALVLSERQKMTIDAYMAKNYPSLREKDMQKSNAGKKLSQAEINDIIRGTRSGESAVIHRGVD